MIISKVISTLIEKGINRVKVLGWGAKDVKTGYQISPFGIDSNVPADWRAIFTDTGNMGEKIIIGYINTNAIAQSGELRLFALKSDNSDSFYIHLKNDGTCDLGGTSDFAVKFSGLESEFNKLKKAFNDFALAYKPGGPAAVGLPAVIQQCDADISQAKNDKIKTL